VNPANIEVHPLPMRLRFSKMAGRL
jgi:hypothetical protein